MYGINIQREFLCNSVQPSMFLPVPKINSFCSCLLVLTKINDLKAGAYTFHGPSSRMCFQI